jgi:hypothetical protein
MAQTASEIAAAEKDRQPTYQAEGGGSLSLASGHLPEFVESRGFSNWFDKAYEGFLAARLRKDSPTQPASGAPIEADVARDECQRLARAARDAFKSACESGDADQADSLYGVTTDSLEELWKFAALRDQPFRDLLAALEAALRDHTISDFSDHQRNVLRHAFADLTRWLLEENAVEAHLAKFADTKIDILGPVRKTARKFRIVIEEID